MTYNVTAYYENHGMSARVSTTFTQGNQVLRDQPERHPGRGVVCRRLPAVGLLGSVKLGQILGIPHLPELTFDVINITKEKQRTYFQFPNAAFTAYKPGRTIMIGLRDTF